VKSHARRAADIMTRDVVSVSETTSLADITDIIEDRKIKRVPVTRDGRLVGIVSRADLLRALVAAAGVEPASPGDDAAIKAELIAELQRQRWARSTGVCIEVKDGVVRLSGIVPPTPAERTALRIAAERVAGVRTVEDALAPIEPRPGL
jgi:CBS domain-containing protein